MLVSLLAYQTRNYLCCSMFWLWRVSIIAEVAGVGGAVGEAAAVAKPIDYTAMTALHVLSMWILSLPCLWVWDHLEVMLLSEG